MAPAAPDLKHNRNWSSRYPAAPPPSPSPRHQSPPMFPAPGYPRNPFSNDPAPAPHSPPSSTMTPDNTTASVAPHSNISRDCDHSPKYHLFEKKTYQHTYPPHYPARKPL